MQANTRKARMLATVLAFATTAGIAATAQAGDDAKDGPRYASVVVKYSDLDLNGADGNKVLYARLSFAAKRACGSDPGNRDLQRRMEYRSCYDGALDRAVEKIGTRELQALHATDARQPVG